MHIILGGSRGIGKSIAKKFIASGRKVLVVSRSKPQDLDCEHLHYDLSSSTAEFPKIKNIESIVFSQKNRNSQSDLEEVEFTVLSVAKILRVLKDSFLRNGSILLMGSSASELYVDEQPLSYHLSKGSLPQLARFLSEKFGSISVKANCIIPGTVLKEENKNFYNENDELLKMYKKLIPRGEIVSAEEIAEVAFYLTSQQSSCISGQTIYVDAGASNVSQETIARRMLGLEHPNTNLYKDLL